MIFLSLFGSFLIFLSLFAPAVSNYHSWFLKMHYPVFGVNFGERLWKSLGCVDLPVETVISQGSGLLINRGLEKVKPWVGAWKYFIDNNHFQKHIYTVYKHMYTLTGLHHLYNNKLIFHIYRCSVTICLTCMAYGNKYIYYEY